MLEGDADLQSIGNFLIRPDGWHMPTAQFWTDNGFSHEKSMAQGVPIRMALERFIAAIEEADLMVAHNADFDSPIVGSELFRAGLRSPKKLPKFCTMKTKSIIDYCALPSQRGGLKWPKLEELHIKLFGKNFDGAHDSLADVRATAACFFKLQSLNIINPLIS